MNKTETKRFDRLYQKHLQTLKIQGKAEKTIDNYARALRRIRDHFDCSPDSLTKSQLQDYFAALAEGYSWSTVKVNLWGLKHFWKFVLEKEWNWVEIVKPPKVQSIPDILTQSEIERILAAITKLRYRVFLLTTYSMGLRLSETLHLEVGDIDSERKLVHIRRGKGFKDRMVPLPDLTLHGLRELWKSHRNPNLLFPNPSGSPDRIRSATMPMDAGGIRSALRAVLKDCGIRKRVSVHSLRHSYATHLLERGLSVRHIQKILGHATPNTTVRYTRYTTVAENDSRSVIDRLMGPLKVDFRPDAKEEP